jgi:ABC-type Fe3+ transport system substrate-binding protein
MTKEPARLTFFGKLIVFLFLAGCGFGAWKLISRGTESQPSGQEAHASASSSGGAPAGQTVAAPARPVATATEIGICYGTEKERWLKWAATEFARTPEGSAIKVNLVPKGSLEGAQAILKGDTSLHVWSPASDIYRDTFEQEWRLKYNSGKAIASSAELALTPMVFVFWAERYDALVKRFGTVDFNTITQALNEPGGWDSLDKKPEWGLFKFGHTHPNESNSGLASLLLTAHEFHKKQRGLAMGDLLQPAFQAWFTKMQSGVSGFSNSTGNMMRDMVLRGPSTYDGLFVYESTVIDYLKNAEGRWGGLKVAYPKINLWNNNPYCIIDAPWSTPAHRKAALAFQEYLLSAPVQAEALKYGFRPANPDVAVKTPESPFTIHAATGLKIDVGAVAEPPRADVISNLLALWQRSRSR